jgi:type 1 glutamine amidotransferase
MILPRRRPRPTGECATRVRNHILKEEIVAQRAVLLLVGGHDYHNQPFHYAELAGILAGEARADLRITADLSVLEPASLARYDAVVNWTTFVEPTPEQVAALLAAVEGGTGFIGLHAATATFWNSAAYLHLIGSRFVRHDPYGAFTVHIVDRDHPVTAGLEDFVVEDELYHVSGGPGEFEALAAAITAGRPIREASAAANAVGEGPLGPGIRVLAAAEGHPLVYVKTHGRGRVYYNALGHDTKALTHPAYRRLVLQGLDWVTGRV